MIRVLVGGSGGTGGNNFIKGLQKAGGFYIIGTTSDPYDVPKSIADETYLVPKARKEEYLEAITKLLEKTKPDFIYPSHDFEVQVLSNNREILDQRRIKYFWPSKEVLNILVNKAATANMWEKNGIKTAHTLIIENVADLEKALSLFGSVWLREMEGGGGQGSLPTNDFSFAKAWIDHFNGWGKFSASELLTAERVSWCSIWSKGELIVAQTRKGLSWLLSEKTLSGVTGVTDVGLTIDDPLVDEVAIKAIKALDTEPNGIYVVDMSYDNEGFPRPTEINPGRFFTPINFFTELGLNMPFIYTMIGIGYQSKLHLPSNRINPLTSGKCWIRNVDMEPVVVDIKDIEVFLEKKRS